MAENASGFALKQCLEEDNHVAHPHKYKDLLYWCEGVDESLARILTDSRKELYGDPVENMHGVAVMWNAYLQGRPIQPWDVPIMHILNKIHRLGTSPDYGDHSDDVDGYMDLFRQVIQATFPQGMIKARTTDEYWKQKHPVQTQQDDKVNDATLGWYAKIGAVPADQNQEEGALIDAWEHQHQDPAQGKGIVPPYIERKIEDHIQKVNEEIIRNAAPNFIVDENGKTWDVVGEVVASGGPDTHAPIDWSGPMEALNNLSIRPSDD